jgi:hypothetical protein
MENRHMRGTVRVDLLTENVKPAYISARASGRAMNRLDATTNLRDDQMQAMAALRVYGGVGTPGAAARAFHRE